MSKFLASFFILTGLIFPLISFADEAVTGVPSKLIISEALPEIVEMVSGPASSNIVVFDIATSEMVMTMGVAQEPVPLTADFFTSGSYAIITTTDRNGCNTLTLDECRSVSGFQEESVFDVSS
ncbi:hypothetical protein EXS71_03945 [Candidatus Uhrbacteria bacterium]|nr:hypothetical protein [Candidatus Uhrbacteria bacterium]